MSLSNELSPADISALTGNNNGFGDGGAWWLIVLFLFAFCGGWGNGYGGYGGASGGASANYVLASDFATIQRQLSDGFNGIDNALDRQNAGLCDLGYTQAQLINNNNISQLQSANAIQSKIDTCCCNIREAIAGVNYNMAQNTNTLQSAVNTGFCQTNYNAQNNTRDIIESQNANTRAILDALTAQRTEALKERIAEQEQRINALQLSASQTAQNAYLINQLKVAPVPAYTVPNPYTGCCNTCGC